MRISILSWTSNIQSSPPLMGRARYAHSGSFTNNRGRSRLSHLATHDPALGGTVQLITRFSITRQRWLFPTLFLALSSSTQAATPEQLDALTEKWLALEQQTRQLETDWAERKPSMEQRLTLLRAERKQLKRVLQQTNTQQDDVAEKRRQLLQQQSTLEQQQQQLSDEMQHLQAHVARLSSQLPPPLQASASTQADMVSAEPTTSEVLEALLSQLNRLDEFNQRITLNEAVLTTPQHQQVLVKQLYLGASIAWFSNRDGRYCGWGYPSDEGWQWQFDTTLDPQPIQQAIAIYEKKQSPQLVQLPLTLRPVHHAEGAQ